MLTVHCHLFMVCDIDRRSSYVGFCIMVSEHFWLDSGIWTIWHFVIFKNYQDLKSEQCLSASASAGHWISIGQSCHCRGANQKPWVCKSRITQLHLLVSVKSFRWILMYRFVSEPSVFIVWVCNLLTLLQWKGSGPVDCGPERCPPCSPDHLQSKLLSSFDYNISCIIF